MERMRHNRRSANRKETKRRQTLQAHRVLACVPSEYYKRSNTEQIKRGGLGEGKRAGHSRLEPSTEMLVVRRPARNWVQLTLPGGQCRILMPEQKNSALRRPPIAPVVGLDRVCIAEQ